MAISRTKAQDYAETVLNRPGGEKPVVLRRHKSGATLLHRGRALTKTHATNVGAMQAQLMADGHIDTKRMLTHTFPLDDFNEAMRVINAREDGVMRAMIVP